MIHQASRFATEKADSPPALALGLSVEAKEEPMTNQTVMPAMAETVMTIEDNHLLIRQGTAEIKLHLIYARRFMGAMDEAICASGIDRDPRNHYSRIIGRDTETDIRPRAEKRVAL